MKRKKDKKMVVKRKKKAVEERRKEAAEKRQQRMIRKRWQRRGKRRCPWRKNKVRVESVAAGERNAAAGEIKVG